MAERISQIQTHSWFAGQMQQYSASRECPGLMTSRPIAAHDPARSQIHAAAPDSRSAHKEKPKVLVTGANGFVGRHLVSHLAAQGCEVIAASRTATTFDSPNIAALRLPDLSELFDWQPFLEQCDVVVHLAGIAHRYAGEGLYDRVNHRATSALARAISRCGTKHLVLIS
jgi:UDP-glucose 4-epimerase